MNQFLSDSSKQKLCIKRKQPNENRFNQMQKKQYFSSKNLLNDKENININIHKIMNNYDSKKKINHIINNTNKFNRKNYKKILNLKNNININPKNVNQIKQIKQYEVKEIDEYNNNFVKRNDSTTNPSNRINETKLTSNIINYCLIKENSHINHNSNISYQINKIKNNDVIIYNSQKELLDNEIEKNFPLPEPNPIKITKSSNNTNTINITTLNIDKKNIVNNSNNYYLNEISNISNNNNPNDYYNKNKRDNRNSNSDSKLIVILNDLNMAYLINIFAIHSIKFNDLLLLTREDLIEMKVPIGPRNKLLHFIEEYKRLMKDLNLEELKLFVNNYNNNISSYIQDRMSDNNIFSTLPTNNNEFSYRIKEKSYSNYLTLNANKEDININKNKNNQYNINNYFSKENYNTKDNFNRNNSNNLFNASCSHRQTNIGKKNINIISNMNNHAINKTKIFNSIINSRSNIDNKNDIDNITLNISKCNKSSKTNNRNTYLRNPLIKLIEDSQTNRTYSVVNGQIVDGTNRNITSNNEKNINTIEKDDKNYIYDYETINRKNNETINNNKKSKSMRLFKNGKKRFKSSHNDKITNTNKIIENFKNLNSEVEHFQNRYKKMQKESYDRKNRIKSLLIEEKKSSRKIKKIKQQIKKIEFSYKSKSLNNKIAKKIYLNSNNNNTNNIKKQNNNKNILINEFNRDNEK